MYIHLAIFRWKANVTEAKVKEVLREVCALQRKIAGIVEISCAKNLSRYSEGYTHVVLVRGLNQKAIDAYRNHPDHIALAKRIEVMEEHGIGVDFVTD